MCLYMRVSLSLSSTILHRTALLSDSERLAGFFHLTRETQWRTDRCLLNRIWFSCGCSLSVYSTTSRRPGVVGARNAVIDMALIWTAPISRDNTCRLRRTLATVILLITYSLTLFFLRSACMGRICTSQLRWQQCSISISLQSHFVVGYTWLHLLWYSFADFIVFKIYFYICVVQVKCLKLIYPLRSHHLPLSQPFTPDLKLICFIKYINPFLVPFRLPSRILNLYRTKRALAFVSASSFQR